MTIEHLHPFVKLNLSSSPVILAPLAGVSDHPFRRVCAEKGADLTYVEMLSATALLYESRRTFEMLKRHSDEKILGVQLTGRNADDTARAVELLDKLHFETIDINMGCPVAKVVKTGCGSAILRDPSRVFETVKRSVEATSKPLSVKIRIGWDRQSVNATEVADAAAQAGAAWLCVHGRTRSDDYSVPVDLDMIAAVKRAVKIPVIGNGNIFGRDDAEHMRACTDVDGVMVSRGALGDPWVFKRIKSQTQQGVSLDEWYETVARHLDWQKEEYGTSGKGAVCMRKHLLWYLKGWPNSKAWKDAVTRAPTLDEASDVIKLMVADLRNSGVTTRFNSEDVALAPSDRFKWDPKWEMDRKLDRGVGDDGLEDVEGC